MPIPLCECKHSPPPPARQTTPVPSSPPSQQTRCRYAERRKTLTWSEDDHDTRRNPRKRDRSLPQPTTPTNRPSAHSLLAHAPSSSHPFASQLIILQLLPNPRRQNALLNTLTPWPALRLSALCPRVRSAAWVNISPSPATLLYQLPSPTTRSRFPPKKSTITQPHAVPLLSPPRSHSPHPTHLSHSPLDASMPLFRSTSQTEPPSTTIESTLTTHQPFRI